MAKETDQEIMMNAVKTVATQDAKNWYKGHFGSDDGEKKNSYWHAKSRADLLAQEILKNGIPKLESLKVHKREDSYNKNHDGTTENEKSNRLEERIAMEMKDKTYRDFGKVLDYQVPLKNKKSDKGLGKIDLIAYNETNNVLTLLELKKPDSDETLLRAALEIYTYWKIVDQKKLLEDFSLSPDVKVEKAVLLFKDSYAYNEYKNLNKTESKHTIELMKQLDIKFYAVRMGVIDL